MIQVVLHKSQALKTMLVKKTRYVNLSKLHISSILAIFLAFCFISATYFFKNFIISNFRKTHKRDFDDQNNLKSSDKAKKDSILGLVIQVKGNK